MLKRFIPVAVAAAAFALPATAATTITITPTPNPCMGPTCTFSVDGNVAVPGGAFTGSQTFEIPMNGAANSIISSIKLTASTDVDFSDANITDGVNTYDFVIFNDVALPGGIISDFATLGSVNLMAGTYTLTVNGTTGANGGTFGGNINFAAVPEASTWALMILGFGVVGGALRRGKVRPALRYA